MKNFTLAVFAAFLMVGSSVNAQTYSTGNIIFFGDYSGKIDVTSTLVTLRLVGPSTSWLGIGFNASAMDDNGMDVVIFDGTNMTDRTFVGFTQPQADAIQNWTVISNTIAAGVRTVVATRARNTGDANDFVFPAAAGPLTLIYARKPGSFVLDYHGSGNCGTTIANLALGTEDYALSAFKMYPNPSDDYTTIELPNNINQAEVILYDFLGRIVKKGNITVAENRFDTSNLQKGSYMIKVSTQEGTATKTLVVN